jgi:hypothetical protein
MSLVLQGLGPAVSVARNALAGPASNDRAGLANQVVGPAADSSSDSNTGGSRRPTTSGSGGGVQVRNAYERR